MSIINDSASKNCLPNSRKPYKVAKEKGGVKMSDGNLLLTLRQINICLGLYESEKLAESEMTFAQAFLLNEIFLMDSSCVCSTELCERVGFTRSSISRTLKELRKNGYVKMKMDKDDNRKKHIVLTPKAYEIGRAHV